MARTSLQLVSSYLLTIASIGNVVCYEADDTHIIYNNELFPRNTPYGKLMQNELSLTEESESRQLFGPIGQNGQGPFNRNPFLGFLSRLPIRRNPEFTSLISTYDSCKAPDGESGICLNAAGCTLIGGRASGSCGITTVCCISAISKCSGIITLNNTYWQSPSTSIASQTSCAVTVRLDRNLPEQKKLPICQLRLDFISFTTAQPTNGACITDEFQASGSSNKAPVICGDNNDQHMYLHVPSTGAKPTDVQLMFSFGASTAPRSWNIKIAMIPCGATYAAPADCLQFFTSRIGSVKSFNWIDAAPAIRQLSKQEYSICFRNELIGDQRANSMCYQVCSTTTRDAIPFRLSGSNQNSAIGSSTSCLNDFLVILGGQDALTPTTTADRYCGGSLNAASSGTSVNAQVCTSSRPFRIQYRTDDNETGETNNTGFCLSFMQRRI